MANPLRDANSALWWPTLCEHVGYQHYWLPLFSAAFEQLSIPSGVWESALHTETSELWGWSLQL